MIRTFIIWKLENLKYRDHHSVSQHLNMAKNFVRVRAIKITVDKDTSIVTARFPSQQLGNA